MFSEIKNTRFFMERSLDKHAPISIENKTVSHCVFDNCSIGTRDNAANISRFKNIRLSDCEMQGLPTFNLRSGFLRKNSRMHGRPCRV